MGGRMLLAAMAAGLLLLGGCAPGLDHLKFTEQNLFPCLRPIDQFNSAEYVGAPSATGDRTTTRVKVFYAGLMKNHSMTIEIMTRQDLVKARVLDDTNLVPRFLGCKYLQGWQPMPK